jgi:hypothetical protein
LIQNYLVFGRLSNVGKQGGKSAAAVEYSIVKEDQQSDSGTGTFKK